MPGAWPASALFWNHSVDVAIVEADTLAVEVHLPEVAHRNRVTGLRRLGVPVDRRRIVELDAFTGVVHEAELVHRLGVAGVGRLEEELRGRGLVLRHPVGAVEQVVGLRQDRIDIDIHRWWSSSLSWWLSQRPNC